MKPLYRFICAGLLPAACVAATQPPASNPARRQILERQREHYLQSVQSLPSLDTHHISDVLRLQTEDGQLTVQTPLTPWSEFMGRRARLDGFRSPAVVTYAQFLPNDPRARQFEFTLEDYPDADTYGRLHLLWRPGAPGHPGEMSIEKTEQTSQRFLRVFYTQNSLSARLLVFDNDSPADRNMQSFDYAEKNFATLRRKHPGEAEKWLRPIFRRLQQDAIFAPDTDAAWQVLSDGWPVPEQVRDAVRRLLPELDNAQSRVRNHAANELAALGRDGATAILRLDRRGLSLEQNVRLDEVVARFCRLNNSEANRLADDPDFMLDCQYCNDPTVRSLAATRLARLLGHPVALDPRAPEAARSAAVEKLRNELHPAAATQVGGKS